MIPEMYMKHDHLINLLNLLEDINLLVSNILENWKNILPGKYLLFKSYISSVQGMWHSLCYLTLI